MPDVPLKACAGAGCGKATRKGLCNACLRKERKRLDAERGDDRAFYRSAAWRRCRREFAALNPKRICAEHFKRGRIEPATIVDHIVPRSVRPELELNVANLQWLCQTCHNQKTARDNKAIRKRKQTMHRTRAPTRN